MRRLRIIWGVGLCLGLAGCAGTRQGLVLGPVTMPGGATGHSHSHLTSLLRPMTRADGKANAPCGCGPTVPTGPVEGPKTAMAPGSPAPSPRFFPPLDAQGEGAQDLKGTARPDPLGVSTTSAVAEPGRETETPVSNDSEALRTSSEGEGEGEEEGPARLPLTVEISVPPDAGPAGPVATVTVDDEVPPESIERVPVPVTVSDERETPAGGSEPSIPQTPVSRTEGPQPPTTALAPGPGPGPVPPRPEGPTALELEEDPVLAGRPRLRHDGTVTPRPAGGDPTSYGPDPTFPASYYAGGSAPTSVPKTREVWPTQPPRRPSLLSRLIRRFRGDVAEGAAVPAAAPASAPAAASARGEPRHLAERGRGVERIAADRLDEAPER